MIKQYRNQIDANFELNETNNINDSLLFECITTYQLNGEAKKITEENTEEIEKLMEYLKPVTTMTVITLSGFASTWKTLSLEQRKQSIVHRAFWLGETWAEKTSDINEELISACLIRDFSEKIKRYKDNTPLYKLRAYDKHDFEINKINYIHSKGYREWVHENKSKAKYEIELIKKFIAGEKISPISDGIWGLHTNIITKEEIENIYENITQYPEPTLPISPLTIETEKDSKTEKLIETVTKILDSNNKLTEQLIQTTTEKTKTKTKNTGEN